MTSNWLTTCLHRPSGQHPSSLSHTTATSAWHRLAAKHAAKSANGDSIGFSPLTATSPFASPDKKALLPGAPNVNNAADGDGPASATPDQSQLQQPQQQLRRFTSTQPEFLSGGGSLHEYQLEGLNWLYHKWSSGENVVLADEVCVYTFILLRLSNVYNLHTQKNHADGPVQDGPSHFAPSRTPPPRGFGSTTLVCAATPVCTLFSS